MEIYWFKGIKCTRTDTGDWYEYYNYENGNYVGCERKSNGDTFTNTYEGSSRDTVEKG